MRKVVIIQQFLPHYRIKFFQLLREELRRHQIDLVLIHGSDNPKNLIASPLEWAITVPTRKFAGFVWLNVYRHARHADLVIMEQVVKNIHTYTYFLGHCLGRTRMAFWGHGKNFQARHGDSLAERVKRWLSKRVDWWFAYNDLSADFVAQMGYPRARITSVQNSIDTQQLVKIHADLTPGDLDRVKQELAISTDHVAVYTGGLYAEKRIEFLLAACQLIRSRIPDFVLIVIGDGPDRQLITDFAAQHPWLKFLGAKKDHEKIPYWAVSKVLLMPGLVGLVVLDSFALGCPIITTAYPHHSPEISYLKPGHNGLLVADWENQQAYADAVIELLLNADQLAQIRNHARAAVADYSVENMAQRYSRGILEALS